MDKPMARILTALAAALVLPGCFLAPHYKRPAIETPPAFKEVGVGMSTDTWKMATPSDAAARGKWWEVFGDPQLNQLEEKVVISNQNVKQAEAQYREATALVKETQSAYFPTLTTLPSVTRERASIATTNGNSNSGTPSTINLFDLPLTASWEPDFWGAVTFAVRTAKAEAQASAALLENMRLSMQAQLAIDYFTLAELDIETGILNSDIASYEKFLQLTKARYSGGVASRADVAQAQTQLDQTRAQATDLGIARAQNEHAIAVLIGQAPSAFSLAPVKIQGTPPPLPPGLPSQLLERRPDIATAERLIVAANGQIGLARAAYFPNISLSATGGYESNTLAGWLTWPQRFWSIGASAAETILDFGRRRAVSQQAQAIYDAQVASYRQTVLGAFQEVEDSLAALRLLDLEGSQQDTATKEAQDSLNLEVDQYKAGTASYLNVITVQNIALNNERTSAQILGRRMTAAVTLIRALGGGWDISQLPWPHNLESLPTASATPASAVGIPNPPALPVVVSPAAAPLPPLPTAVSASSGPAVSVPAIYVSSLPAVSPLPQPTTQTVPASSAPVVPNN